MPKQLIIVQPYVPKYRVAFFEGLIDNLRASNIECTVAAANPDRNQQARGDQVTAPWLRYIRDRRVHVGRRSLSFGGSRAAWRDADGVIVGHVGSSLDTYQALAAGLRGSIRVGLWGHIRSYVNDSHPLDAALESWQLRQADHVFAYTPGGREHAELVGVPAEKITTVMNSIDSSALVQARDELSDADVRDFKDHYALRGQRFVSFFGGLDESKRISFLAASLEVMWAADPDLQVLIGGQGTQAHLLQGAVDRGQAIMLGYATPRLQALCARLSSAILMPGRIGLVAVDALILQLPIITTDWPYHAPEFEYLTEGKSLLTVNNDVYDFASFAVQYAKEGLMRQVDADWSYPTLSGMVSNFAAGVVTMMESRA